MGNCWSTDHGDAPEERPHVPNVQTATAKPCTNVKNAVKESDTASKLVAWLKQATSDPLGQYLQFYLAAEKRIQIYRSGQKCGDDKEKGDELLLHWTREILGLYGSLVFDGLLLKDLVPIDATGTDVFATYASSALETVQKYLDTQ